MSSILQPHAEVTKEEDGTLIATSEMHQLTILPDGPSSIVNRNGLKRALGPDVQHVRWLRGELNGVKVYVNGSTIVMTTRDLYP